MCVCNENMCADNKTYVFRPDWTWWCWRWPPCRWGAPRTPGWPARTPRSRGPRAQTPGSEIRVGNGQSAMFIYIYPVFEYPSFSSLSNNLVIDIGQGGKRGRELLPAGFRLTWRWMLVEVVWYNIDNCIWSQHLQYLQYLQYLPLCPGPSKLCQPSCGPRPLWRHSGRTPHQYHINSEAETEDGAH